MNDSRPHDLTQEELALIQSAASGRETAPSRIPPGTQVAIELLNPIAGTTIPASPTAGPNQMAGSETGSVARTPPSS